MPLKTGIPRPSGRGGCQAKEALEKKHRKITYVCQACAFSLERQE